MNELEKIFESDFKCCFITSEECFEILKNKGYKVTLVDEDEYHEDYSTDIEWYSSFMVQKNDKKYDCTLKGSASKEISCDRWVDTINYSVDTYEIKVHK